MNKKRKPWYFLPKGFNFSLYRCVKDYNRPDWYVNVLARRWAFNLLEQNDEDSFDGGMETFINGYSVECKNPETQEELSFFQEPGNMAYCFQPEGGFPAHPYFGFRELEFGDFMTLKPMFDSVGPIKITKDYEVIAPQLLNIFEDLITSSNRPLVQVNLEAPNEKIEKDFKSWLAKARESRKVSVPKHNRNKKSEITEANIKKWVRDRVLYYIDLRHLGMRHGLVDIEWSAKALDNRKTRFATNKEWADFLFSDKENGYPFGNESDFRKNTIDASLYMMTDPDFLKLLVFGIDWSPIE